MKRTLLPGTIAWAAIAIVAATGTGPVGLLEVLFLLAAWLVVPLGLEFLPDSPPLRIAKKLQPAASILATVSFFLPKGPVAAALAAPWLALNGLVALGGFFSLKESFRGGIPSLLILAAMMFPPVGGIHLVASRYGYPLGGFPEPIVILTAVHFHYTAFAAPILAGLAARALTGPAAMLEKIGGAGLVVGTPLLAAGFLFSPKLKIAAVGLLCVSMILAGLAQLAVRIGPPRARLLLAVSSLAIVAGMVLAAVYEHGFTTGRTWISIPTMARTHGLLNGLGYSLCGLLAWMEKKS